MTNTQDLHISYAKSNNWRETILLKFFESIGPLHDVLYKHRPNWNVSTAMLLAMPAHSLGYGIGKFLQADNLEPIPRAERHDVFHVLLQYGTTVREEAGMQFCILGAGKHSPSVLSTIALAIVFLPEHWTYFYNQYSKGKNYLQFYKLPFQHLLDSNLHNMQSTILKRKS